MKPACWQPAWGEHLQSRPLIGISEELLGIKENEVVRLSPVSIQWNGESGVDLC